MCSMFATKARLECRNDYYDVVTYLSTGTVSRLALL
jgi:hypothetical protein